LNLPGVPDGTAFQPESIDNAILRGVGVMEPRPGMQYRAHVDMSGGSDDDATLGISSQDPKTGRITVVLVMNQGRRPPFDPRLAVDRFEPVLRKYGIAAVNGDQYAGQTFRADFARHGIHYRVCPLTEHQLYEWLEPILNGGRVRLVDVPELEQQLLGLVWRGTKIDHQPGEHDDYANACAGAVWAADKAAQRPCVACLTVPHEWVQDRGGRWRAVPKRESVRAEMERCREADRERSRNGEQEKFLRRQAHML
jgi:hypothetical protein